MRDVFIERLYQRMKEREDIYFLSADFGAPMLDTLKKKCSNKFINVGVAEQNLINISAGLALEGFNVYAYGIAPFLSMRPYEQIRINLSLLSQLRPMNVNLVGVGAGLSYETSGPTHHCLEDIGIMRMLPNMTVFSPSDWVLTEKFVDYSLAQIHPKYIRLDGKSLPQIYQTGQNINIADGFFELYPGCDVCIVATGYMTHKAINIRDMLKRKNLNVGIVDVFLLKPINDALLASVLKKYKYVLTLEEAFIGKGGLDALISDVILKADLNVKLKCMGFKDSHCFEIGGREYLHKLNGLDENTIAAVVKKLENRSI
jgi:transketolase